MYSDWVIQYRDLTSEQKMLVQLKRDRYEQDPTEVHLKELQDVLQTVGAVIDKKILKDEVIRDIAALGPISNITLDTYSQYEEDLQQIKEKMNDLLEVWPNFKLTQYESLQYHLNHLFGEATSLEEALIYRAHVALIQLPMPFNISVTDIDQVKETRKYVNAALEFTSTLQNLWKLEGAERKLKELAEV